MKYEKTFLAPAAMVTCTSCTSYSARELTLTKAGKIWDPRTSPRNLRERERYLDGKKNAKQWNTGETGKIALNRGVAGSFIQPLFVATTCK